MRRWFAGFGRATSAAAVGLTLGSCGEDLGPCGGVKKGDRFRIEVIGVLRPDTDVLSRQWGFAPGAVVEGTIVDLQSNSTEFCQSGILDASGIGDWTWDLRSDTVYGGGFLVQGSYGVTLGACFGTLEMYLPSASGVNNCGSVDSLEGECTMTINTDAMVDAVDACPEFVDSVVTVTVEKL